MAFLMITGQYPFEFDDTYGDELDYKNFNLKKLSDKKMPKEVIKFI